MHVRPGPRPRESKALEVPARHTRFEGQRSRYERCPNCKKIRLKRFDANWHGFGRRRWLLTPFGKVCHLCAERYLLAIGFRTNLAPQDAVVRESDGRLGVVVKVSVDGLAIDLRWSDAPDYNNADTEWAVRLTKGVQ